MQISKRLILICAATVAVSPLTTVAVDNAAQTKARQALESLYNQAGTQPAAAPAQGVPAAQLAPTEQPIPAVAAPQAAPVRADSDKIAKAREALRNKMAEVDAQNAASAQPAPVVAAPKPAKPAAREQPVAPAVAAPAPQVSSSDEQSVEKAREALRKKMAELESQPQSSSFSAAPSTPAPAVQTEAPAPAAVQPPASGFSELSASQAESAKLEQAREALRKQMEASAQQPAVAKEAPAPAKPRVAEAEQAKKSPPKVAQQRQYQPLEGPALPFTQEQQAQLAELLRKYRADEITPDQYHAERAKIIGQKP